MFLESVARNSRNSKAIYETGLKHFQRFIVGSVSTSNNYQNYNVESIITAIQAGGAINVYELMDGLVSYFVVRLSHKQYIAPTSIFLYVHAVKSYLLYHDIDINPLPRPLRNGFQSYYSSSSKPSAILRRLLLFHIRCCSTPLIPLENQRWYNTNSSSW
jgi:hypothetical protein